MKLKDFYISKNIIKRIRTSFSNGTAIVAPNDAINLQETIQEAIDDGSLVISGGGSGSTNLSVGATTGTTMVIASSSGTDATVPSATTSNAGLLSATDKVKLDSLVNYTHPNHSGDIVSVNDGATTIQTNVVTNTKLADMPANSVKVRAANTTGDPSDLQLSANQLIGRGSSGDITPITLGTNLSISGTTLNATGSGGYSTIQDEGTPLTSRSTLDFVGDGVNITDNGTKTIATIATRVASAINGVSTETNAGLLTTVLGGTLDRNTSITGGNTRSFGVTDLSSFTLEAESLTPGQRLYRILANSISASATFLGQIVGGTDSSTLSISPSGTSSLSRVFAGGSSSVNVSNAASYIAFNDGTNRSISAQSDGINFQGVTGATTTDILYYNTTTGAVTYGTVPSGGSSQLRTTAGSASIIYEVLSGSPIIAYSKSGGAGTMSVTGGTIRLRRFADNILDAERDGTNNFKWILVGTGTDILLARPTSSKYTLNAADASADASTNATVANQIDQDNTPPVLYGNFVLTGQGGVTIRSNNIPTSGSGAGNGYDFIW